MPGSTPGWRAGSTGALLFLVALLLALGAAACGSSSPSLRPPPIVIATLTPAPEGAAPVGGKPAAAVAASTAAALAATPLPTAASTVAPTTGRWIEVDVTRLVVRLMQGQTVLRTIQPVAVGAQIDTGAYESTQTGLFYVYDKREGLQYDAPYKTYISDWVAFDAAKANGFHSFLKDERGNVVDASTGRISNGCIRTGESAALFEFAEIGMPVLVHL